jgi:hypothetical protein
MYPLLISKVEDKSVTLFAQPNSFKHFIGIVIYPQKNCECLCTFLQWEELQGGFEQKEYLRDILKDHLDKRYANTTLTEVK